ncbi:hypothetical protein FBU30_007576 [Linnemannia zychae]|nr:hypothetical protein FBU30_007576 [Linnemannia zychae]
MSNRRSNHHIPPSGAGNSTTEHGSTQQRSTISRSISSATNIQYQQQQHQQHQQHQQPPQTPTIVPEIENATHIVVEHHRSGTVKTHVFASKDGKPSLFGHEVPDTHHSSFKEILEADLDGKMRALKTLVQDSLDETARTSLDKFDSIKLAIVESEHRLSAQVPFASAEVIEQQIKTDIIPKLDSIERLLLANASGNSGSHEDQQEAESIRAGAESPQSVVSGSSSMEHMDRRSPLNQGDDQPDDGDIKFQENKLEDNENMAAPSLEDKVLEKLNLIESQLGAISKVVIDGEIPSQDEAHLDPESAAKRDEMLEQLLSIESPPSNNQSVTLEKFDELIQAINKHQESHESVFIAGRDSAEKQEQIRKNEDEIWKASLKELLATHQTSLGDLESHLSALEKEVKNMDTGFQEWTKTHRMSLNVYLKYMYMVFKSTKGVESRIDTALEDIRAQTKIGPECQKQFSSDMETIRTEISEVLKTLPETIATAIKRSQESVILEELLSNNDETKVSQPLAARSALGSNARLQMPGALPASSAGAEINTEDSQADPEPIVEVKPSSDTTTERLVLAIETLQTSVASMVEKYSELAELVAPRPPTPPPRDCPAVGPEAHESLSQGPTIEDRLKLIEEQLAAVPAEVPTLTDAAATPASDLNGITDYPLPPLPDESGADNPNPGPSPGYLGRSASVIAAATAAADAAARDSKTEITNTQKSDEIAEAAAAANPIAGSSFLEELESMNKSLTSLLRLVNESQNHLHQEMQREFLRLFRTIQPPETEEDLARKREAENIARMEEMEANSRKVIEDQRRAVEAERFRIAEEKRIKEEKAVAEKVAEERKVALERISTIPKLMNSLEGVSHHLGQKSDDLTAEVREIKGGIAAVERQVNASLNRVQCIIDGNIQDSAALNKIRYNVDRFETKLDESIDSKVNNGPLKSQMDEAIKRTDTVVVLIENVKRINDKSLAAQEELQKQVAEWYQKQDEKVEALDKKHIESWEAWSKKHDKEWAAWHNAHGESLASLVSLYEQQENSLSTLTKTELGHYEELSGWHKSHDTRLEKLEMHHSHCSHSVSNAREECINKSIIDASSPHQSSLTIDCCGREVKNIHPYTQRVRELLEEFLQRLLPNYNPDEADRATRLTSGIIVPELHNLSGSGIGEEQQPTSPGLSFTTRETSGNIMPEPSIHTFAPNVTVIPRGEADSYHGFVGETDRGIETTVDEATPANLAEGSTRSSCQLALVSPEHTSLPQALYDLLRPFFHPSEAASASKSVAVGITASAVAESIALAELRQELKHIQSQLEIVNKDLVESEETAERLMTTVQEKHRELEEMTSNRIRMEEEMATRQTAWATQVFEHQQELALVRAELEHARRENTNLYRTGLGLKPDLPQLIPAPAVEANGEPDNVSENGSIASLVTSSNPEIIPQAGLMFEASAALRQILDEFNQQKAVLHQEIMTLEVKKDQLIEEVAGLERQCMELSAVINADAATHAQAISREESRRSGPQDAQEPVDDDNDENYVTEDESVGRSSRSSRSRPQSVQGGSVAGGFNGSANSLRPGNGGMSVRGSRQQRRQSVYSRAQSRSRGMDLMHQQDRVPQLEADVRICKDGVQSETILSSRTMLTDEQYERIRSSRAEAGIEYSSDDIWSLSFDVRVKMVQTS